MWKDTNDSNKEMETMTPKKTEDFKTELQAVLEVIEMSERDPKVRLEPVIQTLITRLKRMV